MFLVFAVSYSSDEYHGHMFDQVTLDATCTKPVRKHLICSCVYMKEEVIPAKGHADFVKTVGKEATEGDERYHVYVCLVFNEADARGKRRYS